MFSSFFLCLVHIVATDCILEIFFWRSTLKWLQPTLCVDFPTLLLWALRLDPCVSVSAPLITAWLLRENSAKMIVIHLLLFSANFAPDRQADIARCGLRALIAGSVSCFMTACIAGNYTLLAIYFFPYFLNYIYFKQYFLHTGLSDIQMRPIITQYQFLSFIS